MKAAISIIIFAILVGTSLAKTQPQYQTSTQQPQHFRQPSLSLESTSQPLNRKRIRYFDHYPDTFQQPAKRHRNDGQPSWRHDLNLGSHQLHHSQSAQQLPSPPSLIPIKDLPPPLALQPILPPMQNLPPIPALRLPLPPTLPPDGK